MRYEVCIDRGGTFTDCILLDRSTGERRVTKVLSSDTAPLNGIRKLLGLTEADPIPACDVRMGTTVATNALLERTGARTGLLITKGFRDLLLISDQTRPHLFSLDIQRGAPLTECTLEVNARLDPQGEVLETPTDEELRGLAADLSRRSLESIALVVLHAYANPLYEKELAARLMAAWPNGKLPPPITVSTDAASEQGLLGRTGTAILDAYLTPLLKAYLERFSGELTGSRLRLMQSSGGLAEPERFRGPAALLSGPAGGIVAGAKIAEVTGSKKLITFDMGGTSTDVALIEGTPAPRYETVISGVPLRAKMVDLHTIASGGGSECSFNGYGLTVGPRSVGADPGPVCYGKQANLLAAHRERVALTDVNLVLGRLSGEHFPFPLETESSKIALSRIAQRVEAVTGTHATPLDIARGFHAVANTQLAEAIRKVAIERGVDLRSADLLVFGGAAGQHACDLARALGLGKILVHRLSGVLSAYGIGQALSSWSSERDGGRIALDETSSSPIEEALQGLENAGSDTLSSESSAPLNPGQLVVKKELALRYRGTESTITLAWQGPEETRAHFDREHEKRFGFHRPEATVEVVTIRVEMQIRAAANSDQSTGRTRSTSPLPLPRRTTQVLLGRGEMCNCPVYELEDLDATPALVGPALLLDPTGTYFVDEQFQALLRGDLLTIERCQEIDIDASETSAGEAVTDRTRETELNDVAVVQIMATRFASIAEQMGEALRRSASSTNIRDRLDFSCAVFDEDGHLVANAPHIPVHLGAMSESVRAVLAHQPHMKPGDSFLTNDPAFGGSHLPDITVVTPVFNSERQLIALTASRGHHADIGGLTPGSMPAHSTRLEEEGVVFSAERFVDGGQLEEKKLRSLLTDAPYPARSPDENIADLKAQLAANQLGARLVKSLVEETSEQFLASSMRSVRQLAARWMRDALFELPDEPRTFSDELDDGSVIQVRLEKTPDGVHIDFTGSSPELDSNMNAPRAVTLACVLYVLRTLLGRPLPLNQGCLDPVTLTIPPASILDPSPGRAVAAGNVETSQRVVDVLLAAFDLAAASQGTMNNLSFGTNDFGYYETIAGGAGAGPTFEGASAVHTHMTNTRITDAEVLESRFPVRLREFCIRRGSGGAGRHKGGDGVIRELEALVPLEVSLLTSRRTKAPFGLAGGSPGTRGKNSIAGVDVGPTFAGRIGVNERIRLETPGGGGYGTASESESATAEPTG